MVSPQVSILPFDTIGLVMDSKTVNQLKILRVVRLFRLFKLFRIFRASRIFSRWESHISISYSWLSLTKFMVSVAAVSHWVRDSCTALATACRCIVL